MLELPLSRSGALIWTLIRNPAMPSDEPSSYMRKLALMRTVTGNEDPELPLLQRIRSLELTAPQIAAQINASQRSSNRHISTSTGQRRLWESGLHGQMKA